MLPRGQGTLTMQRFVWMGVVVLAALGVWWVASSWESGRSGGAVGVAGSTTTASGSGGEPSVLAPSPGSPAGSRPANLPRAADPRAPDSPSHDSSRGGAYADSPGTDEFGSEIARGVASDSPAYVRRDARPDTNPDAEFGARTDSVATPPAPDRGNSVADARFPGPGPSGSRDGDSQPVPSDPGSVVVADEVVIDFIARRSLGEDPSEEQLNERRGWAATLLSGESQAVRDQLKAQADEAAALE